MSEATTLSAWVEGIGLLAPGINDWPSGRSVLQGETAYVPAPTALPAPELLPPAERRRASRIVKAALAAGLEACRMAGRDPALLANVFASSGGDGHNCHALCEQLASGDVQISPTRFHNSVHNAASGYWSIATGATPAAQVLGAYDASFGAGLLEAMTQVATSGQPVLLVACDSEYPEPLHAKRPIQDTSALALVLAPAPSAQALAELRLATHGALVNGTADPLQAIATSVDAACADIVGAMPPLRGLPLLAALLGPVEAARDVALDYLPPQLLRVTVRPLTPAATP